VEPAEAGGRSDSLGGLRQRWWLILLATGLGVVVAAGWLQAREPVWESTTSVLVHPAGPDPNVAGGRTQGPVNLDTEAQLVRSTAVATGAAERLAAGPPAAELARRVQVEVPPNTSVLKISFAATTPAGAQAGSRAFAEAYLHHREQAAQAELAAQMAAIETRRDELADTLTEVNDRLTVTAPGTPAAVNLESQRDSVADQLTAMNDRLNQLATATVAAGEIISEPRLPTDPSWPKPIIGLASGAALGLAVGVGAAALAERLARRLRRPADLPRRLGVPVLATLTAATMPRHDEIASPYGPAGRLFDRLRNEVLSGLATGQVIVVASATGGAASRLTAANLAASLARSGHEAILVDTVAGPDSGDTALNRLLGTPATPGLSEVLAGRAGIAEALHRPPRFPRLRTISMGATATATGLLQSPALRTVLLTLTTQTGYVVVAAPPTTASADAQSLASHAGAALLVVERHRTRFADLADAADQLRRVGTTLLGAVVVPPATRREPPPDLPEVEPPPAETAEAGDTEGHTLVMPRLAADAPVPTQPERKSPPAPRCAAAPPGKPAPRGATD